MNGKRVSQTSTKQKKSQLNKKMAEGAGNICSMKRISRRFVSVNYEEVAWAAHASHLYHP